MATTHPAPVAKAQMLIRRPQAQVFEALIDPDVTRHFWFTKASGRVEQGSHLRWDWEMYGLGTTVDVKEIEEPRLILFEWNGPDNPSLVKWRLESTEPDQTFLTVENYGFVGDRAKQVLEAIASAGGFSLVLAGLKAFLEHGIELNLIADHDPAAVVRS